MNDDPPFDAAALLDLWIDDALPHCSATALIVVLDDAVDRLRHKLMPPPPEPVRNPLAAMGS